LRVRAKREREHGGAPSSRAAATQHWKSFARPSVPAGIPVIAREAETTDSARDNQTCRPAKPYSKALKKQKRQDTCVRLHRTKNRGLHKPNA